MEWWKPQIKNIKRIVKKMKATQKGWHKRLFFTLHAYQITVSTSTRAIPFYLAQDMETVLPIEVEIHSLQVLMEAELEKARQVKTKYEQLNLIKEKRLTTLYHGQLYQKRMIQAYNKKTRLRQFQVGELVLKKVPQNQQDP